MPTKIFKLAAEITIDGLKKAEKDLSSFEKSLRKATTPIVKFGKQAENIGKEFTKSLTVPIAAAGTAIVASTIKVGKLADKLLDLEQITGLSTNKLQEFQHIARYAGVSFEGLVGIITKFSNSLPQIEKGTGPAADAIKQLGVNIYNASGNLKDMDTLFPELITSLQKVENTTKRNALAQDIFGRSLTDLAPVLGMSAEELKNISAEANNLGLVIDKNALNSANNLRIKIEVLTAQFEQLWTNLALKLIPLVEQVFIPLIRDELIPFIQKATNKIIDLVNKFNALPPEIKETVTKVAAFIAIMGPALIGLGKFLGIIKLLPAAIGAIRLAMIALNSTLLANPFVAVGIAIGALAVGIYKLNKRYEELKEAHKSTIQVLTAEEAQQKEFTKAVDELNKKIKESGISINDVTEFEKQYGEEINTIVDKAEKMNYSIGEGTRQRFIAINTIQQEINQVRKLDGTLIKYINTVKETTKVKRELTEQEKKDIEELQDLENQYYDFLEQKEKERAEREKATRENSIKLEQNVLDEQEEIYQKYRQLTAKTLDEKVQLLVEERNKELAIVAKGSEQERLINLHFQNQIDDLRKEQRQKDIDALENKLQNTVEYTQQILGLFQGLFENQSISLENNYKKEKETIENTITDNEAKTAALEELDKKYDDKRRALMKRQALADKASAIFSIGINTATAIIKALPNLLLSGFIGALGAAQAAIVASKPIPELADGGVIKSTTGGTLVKAAEAGEDEAFIPMTKGTASIANAIIDNMRRESGSTSSLAAGTSLTTTTPISFNIGTFIGDDAGIKELTRRVIPYITSENRRKGI